MRALLLVDIQNDFMPFGNLPVRAGDEVVAVANAVAPRFELVIASQDWHPANHGSFASNHPGHEPGDVITLAGIPQVLWPDHCIQNMPGASFHSGLDVSNIDAVVCKGTDPSIDSYSAFFDNNHGRDTGLVDMLGERGVEEVWIVGLATDYCVRWTALDARSVGLRVVVVADGVRGVELEPGDSERALQEMVAAGCHIARATDALR
ncbi:MAG TPA: bifunctional nicotinamidase/pyrazinamidase [Coriobacteriia bacterium]|nr:bifunctional nicotinamidase/pyrazinamidase [Coriobacteriia bacterium]